MITYLITGVIDNSKVQSIIKQLNIDLANNFQVSQVFFYADAVAIGTLNNCSDPVYSEVIRLIDIADDNNISLAICSAGFLRRQLQLTDEVTQNFEFRGLGQFVAQSQQTEMMLLFPQSAASRKSEKSPSKNNDYAYEILISLSHSCHQNNIKEYLDIALVSSAYDISVAVYASSEVIKQLQKQNQAEIQQVINMMAEFSIPLFSDCDEMVLFNKIVKKIDFTTLQNNSKNHYSFVY